MEITLGNHLECGFLVTLYMLPQCQLFPFKPGMKSLFSLL